MAWGNGNRRTRHPRAEEVLGEAKKREGKKREKHVFDTSEIPHLWAHKVQADARNARGNLYFEGDTIYSYGSHFPIARHVTNSKGKHAVLFTTRTYSSTTAGHISAVRDSIPPGVPVFMVHNPYSVGREGYGQATADYLSRINRHLDEAKTRRYEQRRARDLQAARAELNSLKAFARFFGFKLPRELPKIPAINQKKLAVDTQREKDADAKRLANRKLRWAAEDAARAARQKEREEDNARTLEDRLARWRAGGHVYNRDGFPDYPILRLVDGVVETSMGATVPARDAWRLWQLVRGVVQSGAEWVKNGHTFHIGHYSVDRIDADGTLHAGCHVIPYAEMSRFAPELALAVSASQTLGDLKTEDLAEEARDVQSENHGGVE